MDLGTVYIFFSLFCSFAALWVMQSTTSDAGIQTPLSFVKLTHRISLGAVSIVMFSAAAHTLYTEKGPRTIDFLVQFVLVGVLAISAIRHMAAPVARQKEEEVKSLAAKLT